MGALATVLILGPALEALRDEADLDLRKKRRDSSRSPVRACVERNRPLHVAGRARKHLLQRPAARRAPRRHPPVVVRRPAEAGCC